MEIKQRFKVISDLKRDTPYILIGIVITISYLLQTQDLVTFLMFISLIPIFAYFKFDGRIPVAYAIIMLVLTVIVLAIYNNDDLANRLAIYAYYLLIVGVSCLFIEYVRERKLDNKVDDQKDI